VLAQPNSHHKYNHSIFLDLVDDSVTLPNSTQASKACQICEQRLTLFSGFLREAVYSFAYFFLDAAI
jgi:hypothetical protein